MRPLPLDRLAGSAMGIIDPVHAEEAREETKFYITSGKRRGIPTNNIYTARNMAITATNEMTNIRWER